MLKRRYFLHIQNLKTKQEKTGHITSRDIGTTIKAIFYAGWHTIEHRIADPNDLEDWKTGNLVRVKTTLRG